jgi:hypothetical protein
MKHIKRFSDTQKVNEEVGGALMIGGLLLTFGPRMIKAAKSICSRGTIGLKYKPTGKEEMVPTKNEEIKFQQFKDNSTGEILWACTFSLNSATLAVYRSKSAANIPDREMVRGSSSNNKNEDYMLFSELEYKKIKEELSKAT